MARYVAGWVGSWEGDEGHISMTVHEAEPDEPRETGLLNHRGEMIYRLSERQPIGFRMKPRVRVKAGGSRNA